jgi:hypothetical protein
MLGGVPVGGGEEQVQALGLVLEVEGFDDGFAHEGADGFAFGGGEGLEDGLVGRGEFEADGGDLACC